MLILLAFSLKGGMTAVAKQAGGFSRTVQEIGGNDPSITGYSSFKIEDPQAGFFKHTKGDIWVEITVSSDRKDLLSWKSNKLVKYVLIKSI